MTTMPTLDAPTVLQHVHNEIRQLTSQDLWFDHSRPHHPNGMWFMDYVCGPNRVVVQYSPELGWGVSYNTTEFGDVPDLLLERKDVAHRVAALLQATHKHYKGGIYRLLNDDVSHTENGEILSIYQHVWPHELAVKARPKDNFHGRLDDGQLRFAPLAMEKTT